VPPLLEPLPRPPAPRFLPDLGQTLRGVVNSKDEERGKVARPSLRAGRRYLFDPDDPYDDQSSDDDLIAPDGVERPDPAPDSME
jgi:hypothetical protein